MKLNPMRLKQYLFDKNNINFRYLITAVSYEERGLFSVKSIIENLKIEKSILILFDGRNYLSKTLQDKWEEQKKQLLNIFDDNKIEHVEVNCNSVFFTIA